MRLNLASSPITFSSTWKPGGTAILSTGSITGRITATGTDEWGRWSYQTFQGQHQRHITIITVYQVVEKFTAEKGQFTTAAQQRSLLIRQGEAHIEPRQAFQRDLRQLLHQLVHDLHHEILVLGDFNERLGDNLNGTAKLAAEFNLTDILSIQHPHLQDPATYTRGHKRLDFALGSDRIATAVQACGYEAFNYRFHTDHRAYFIDLNTELLFGSATQQLSQPSARILHSNNIKQVTSYVKEKHALLKSCNAFARAEQLAKPGERHQFAERLDADVLRLSLIAERRTQRFREPLWSIELAQARHRVSILSKALTMAKTGLDHTKILQQAQEKYPIYTNHHLPATVDECSTELKRAKSNVRDIINRSYATRESERDKQIAMLESEVALSKPNKAMKAKLTILRNLKKAEAIKKLFQKLQNLRQTRQRGGITRLEIPENPHDDPKTCIRWKVIDVPTEILQQLILRNRKHFGQAQGTPFTVPPLSDDLAFTSMTPSGTLILNGQYDAAHLDASVQLLIHHLFSNERASEHKLKPSINYGEFVSKLKTWRESTSTSPSGLHLGHYKALLARHEYSDLSERDPRRAEFEQQQNDILTMHFQMINYGLETGYSYQRWQQVVNAMIFKEPGNIKIHRTRVIHLYEADYNLAMGLKWKAAMEVSEKVNAISEGQYGSRPSRGAYDPVFIEEFQLEISRSSRKSLVQINYDATSCYDRIIPNLAALVSQQFGVPQPVVKANVSTLEKAKYKLRTELGVSDEYYSHTPEYPIYGTGQGSGNSPMIWCFVSSILFDSYESKAHGATYATPDKSLNTKIQMIGYVDDSNGQTNRFLDDNQPTDEDLLRDAQQDAQCWHDLLHATGGALELPKCSYQLTSWRFLESGLPVLQAGVPTFPLQVNNTDPTGSPRTQAIPGMSAYTAHKTLGHYKDPNGAQVRQRKELAEKCNKAAAFISRSPLNREEAWTYYFSIFLPSVGYPLPSCHFSKSALTKIQRTVMSALIAKCGYNRKTKQEIIYGPAHLGGANFRSLYSVQGVGQTIAFLKYWRSPCQAGKLLRIAVAWTQLSLGTSKAFLWDTSTKLPHMESKWLKSLRDYMKHTGGRIELDNNYIPKLERVHDSYIMDMILDSHQFNDKEIRQLNYCRLYLQAVTLSDITQANGRTLDPYMLQGNTGPYSSTSRWHHVTQEKPIPKLWQVWKRANRIWSNEQGELHQPLHRWQTQLQRQRRAWPIYGDKKGRIYIQTTSMGDSLSAAIYSRIQLDVQNNDSIYYSIPQPLDGIRMTLASMPMDATPLDAISTADEVTSTKKVVYQRKDILSNKPRRIPRMPQGSLKNQDFEAYVKQLPSWEAELLSHVHLLHDVFTTFSRMQTQFCAASDGSVRNMSQGAFGWIVSTVAGERLVTANGLVRGYKLTSYRAEGYGMLATLRFLKHIQVYCKASTPSTWKWTLSSDNISLVNSVNGVYNEEDEASNNLQDPVHDWSIWKDHNDTDIEDPLTNWATSAWTQTNTTLAPDWDVLNEIRWTLEYDSVEGGEIIHIAGHQDRTKPYTKLTLQAQLNVDADSYGTASPEVLLFPHAAAQIHIPKYGVVTYRLPQTLRRAESEDPLYHYIRDRNRWTDLQMKTIDWDAHRTAITKQNKRRIQITKLIHDAVPTNRQVHRHNASLQKCPSCNDVDYEDRDHVMRCSDPARERWRAELITTLEHKCQSLQTDIELARILIDGVYRWLAGSDTLQEANYQRKFRKLIRHQNEIGWRQLFNGRMSTEWARLQTDYIYEQRQKAQDTIPNKPVGSKFDRRNGTTWTAAIISTLWEQWFTVWKTRNEAVHGHDQATRTAQINTRNQQWLRAIYEKRDEMEPSVREELLYSTVEEHLAHPHRSIQNWIAVHEGTITSSIKRAATRAIQGMRSITSYFATGRPPGDVTARQRNPQMEPRAVGGVQRDGTN